jgi:hypothetical protein
MEMEMVRSLAARSLSSSSRHHGSGMLPVDLSVFDCNAATLPELFFANSYLIFRWSPSVTHDNVPSDGASTRFPYQGRVRHRGAAAATIANQSSSG